MFGAIVNPTANPAKSVAAKTLRMPQFSRKISLRRAQRVGRIARTCNVPQILSLRETSFGPNLAAESAYPLPFACRLPLLRALQMCDNSAPV
jgi:hypothetical protein